MQPTDVRVEVSDGVRLRVRRWSAPAKLASGSGGAAAKLASGSGDAAGTSAPAGLPFLLVHGLSSNALLWDEVARRLATAGHPTYAVDLRSHGESDAPPDGYDTATAAADLEVISTSLGITPAVVAGQSWGGNVVVRLAAKHPSLVGALALVDGGWLDLSAEFATWEECAQALRPPDVDDMYADDVRGYIRREHSGWSAAAVEATLANLRVNPDGHLERRLPIPQHMRIVRSMWDDPPWPDFPSIAVPVLLLPAIPSDPAAAERRRGTVAKAAGALARARVKEYVGGDHDLHAQHPEALASDLLTLAVER